MYTQEITRCHRAAIVIAIDQSSSMGGSININNNEVSKAEVVSMVTGRLIDELILRSRRDNGYRNYYDIALIGYSKDSVYSLLGDEIAFVPITDLVHRSVRRVPYLLSFNTISEGVRGMCENVSMWIEPRAEGSTPMYKMINCVIELVRAWCDKEENRESFPPLVFNITDGEASDANYDMLRSAAMRLRETGTQDGETLFANVHISSDTAHSPILFPSVLEVPLSIRHAHLLMDMSSIIPEQIHSYICNCRRNYSQPPYIAMSYNSSISELVAMLNIGSRSPIMGL
uniref:vWA domain-containing protein n=1 Tax=Alistipes sp. TaxID=1872444 RepID=UPI0040573B26